MNHKYLVGLVFLLAFQCLKAANILSNPGFENGQDWWGFQTPDGLANIDYLSSAARTGSNAARIHVAQAAAGNHQIQLNAPSDWTAENGAKYVLGFYAKADRDVSIHVAAQDGPPSYGYRTGSDFSLGEDWKYVEMTYISDVEGEGALRFNIFVGAAAANYYFDDFSLEVVQDTELGAPVPPTEGAYYTDVYRNMFLEMGKTESAINNKVDAAFRQLFHGNASTEAVYFEVAPDMAFIKDIANNDVRSEGVSYGMMIAVQLDKKEEFDRLWKFAKTYMQHQSGPRKGYFAWQVEATPPYAVMDPNSAPDGEEYMAMSLFFAAHRWGNGTGIFHYEAEARQLLYDMLNLETRNGGVVDQLRNMFDKNRKQVVFVPRGDLADFSDPSYHLPAFYKLWSFWADTDKQFWADAADTSRAYFLRAMHPLTGLVTDYMTFDGTPQAVNFNDNSVNFAYDSWRVIGNIAMDAHWFGDSWHSAQVDRLLAFFSSQGANYPALYHQDGTPTSGTHTSGGLYAMNGAGALASNSDQAWSFLDRLYSQALPTGQYRYYDGLLHMLALLHASGNFKIWKPEITTSALGRADSPMAINVYPNPVRSGTMSIQSESLRDGQFELKDLGGRILIRARLAEGKVEVSVEDLPEGMYFACVKDARGDGFTERVIIKK